MELLITGASGTLGRRVVRVAHERGHRVRGLSRTPPTGGDWVQGDLAAGAGLPEAVTGIDAIIHCATDSRRPTATDVGGTRHLVAAAQAAGGPLLVYPGIVGSDVIPLRYYRAKTAVESMLLASGLPVTIQRYTQFHDLLWWALEILTRSPLVPLPNDTRFQVLDVAVAARHLVEAAEHPAAGRLPDLGGPTVYDVRDLARSTSTALGRRRRFVRLNVPGLVGAAFRAGGNLTENRDDTGRTWNDFVAARTG